MLNYREQMKQMKRVHFHQRIIVFKKKIKEIYRKI